MADSFFLLTNPPFPFQWNGKTYQITKATLGQIAQFQQRSQELVKAGDLSMDPKLAAYALYLSLSKADPEITEQDVLDNTTITDTLPLMIELGFMRPAKETPIQNQSSKTSETSTSSSPENSVGDLETSPS